MPQTLTFTPNDGSVWIIENALDVTNKDLPNAVVGVPFSHQFNAVNGAAPYTFSSGPWPTGITMSSTGLVSGTPVAAGNITPPAITVQSS